MSAFADDISPHAERLLMHACCGPCSLEPIRILRERGLEPHIYYANSNIAPSAEYERRLETIRKWTAEEGVPFTEGPYDPDSWKCTVAAVAKFACDEGDREQRCRACYRLRFEESAKYASENGYTALGTTLSVSPYQYTEAIRDELEAACAKWGLRPAFEDWRPYYDNATRRSREAGMYRQNYCGCAYSKAEAKQERAERKAARKAAQAARAAERATERAEQQAALERRREERHIYDSKRARQRAILKELRTQKKMQAETRAVAQARTQAVAQAEMQAVVQAETQAVAHAKIHESASGK